MNRQPALKPELWPLLYHNYLSSYASLRVPNNMIEDLVQETYLAGLKSKGNFKFKSQEKTWLISILRNKIVDYYRKVNSNKGLVTERAIKQSDFNKSCSNDWMNIISSDLSAEQVFNVSELKKVISYGIKKLPPQERKVFILKRKGLRTEEICNTLNISDNQCWVLLSKARKRLKQHLKLNWNR